MAALTKSQQKQLADLLRNSRVGLGISAREVGRRAGVDGGTVTRLERSMNPRPSIENLSAIAEVLGIPTADIFALTKVLPKDELPTFTPYLRAKYHGMPDSAIAELETYFQQIARKHHISPNGPQPGEDE